jgi:hypothetical protein
VGTPQPLQPIANSLKEEGPGLSPNNKNVRQHLGVGPLFLAASAKMPTCFRPRSLDAILESLLVAISKVEQTEAAAGTKQMATINDSWHPPGFVTCKEEHPPLMPFAFLSVPAIDSTLLAVIHSECSFQNM